MRHKKSIAATLILVALVAALFPAYVSAANPTVLSAVATGTHTALLTWAPSPDEGERFRVDIYMVDSASSVVTCGTDAPLISTIEGGNNRTYTNLQGGGHFLAYIALANGDRHSCNAGTGNFTSVRWVQDSDQLNAIEAFPLTETSAQASWSPLEGRARLDLYEGSHVLNTCPGGGANIGGVRLALPFISRQKPQRFFSSSGSFILSPLSPGLTYTIYAAIPPDGDEGTLACNVTGFKSTTWEQVHDPEDLPTRLRLRSDTWIDAGHLKAWVFESGTTNGYMLIMVGYELFPSLTEENPVFSGIGHYTVDASAYSTASPWPTQHVQRIGGTEGWGRGAVLLVGEAYDPLDYNSPGYADRIDTIKRDSTWRVVAYGDAFRMGPGVEYSQQFTPTIYLDDADLAQQEFLDILRWVEDGQGLRLVVGGKLTSLAEDYVLGQVPGLNRLMPDIFRIPGREGVEVADVRGNIAEVNMVTGVSEDDRNRINNLTGMEVGTDYVGGLLKSISDITGGNVTYTAVGGFGMVLFALFACTLVAIVSGKPPAGIPAFVIVIGAAWWQGWIDGQWVGAATAIQVVVLAWVLYLKKA